jgi:O-antigen/teichoic acid export membrane protein
VNIRGVLGFAIGPVFTAAVGFVTVPLIAWTFAAEDVARYNLYQQTMSFLLLFATLGLDQAYVREYHERTEKGKLLRTCLAPGLVLAAVIVMCSALFARPLSLLVYGIENPTLIFLTLAAFLLSVMTRFLSLTLRMQERGLAYSLSELIPRFLLLALVAVVAAGEQKPDFMTLLTIAVCSVFAVAAATGLATRNGWLPALAARSSAVDRRSLLGLALPLALASLIFWGLTAVNVMALRRWSTFEALAEFSLSVSIANAAGLFQAIFTVVWAPVVYRWVASGVDLNRIDDVSSRLLALICAIFVAAGMSAPLIDYLLPARYAQVKSLVLCSIVPPLLYTLSEVTGVGIVVARRTMFSIGVTTVALVTTMLSAYLLVPQFGARGAVVSHALGFFVFFIGRTEASRAVWRKAPRQRLYQSIGGCVVLSAATALGWFELWWLTTAAWALYGVVVGVVFSDVWSKLRQDIVRMRRAV